MKSPTERKPLKKCLLIHGGHDTGKTFIAELVADKIGAKKIYMADFGVNYRSGADWLTSVIDTANEQPIMLDDLGAEGDKVDYGSHAAVDAMLLSLIENFKKHKHPIIVTMNPKPTIDDMTDYAGPRVAHRIMSYFIHLNAGDVPYAEAAK